MYAVTIENRGDTRYHATSRGYEFVLGPQGAGANPGDTLLAGLCGCIGHYVRQFLQERGIASDGFRIARIDVWIDLEGMSLPEPGRKLLLAAADRCKLHNTLKAACPVTIALGKRPSQGATSRCG